MARNAAEEGWFITTATPIESARDLAGSASARLIGGKGMADQSEDLRQAEQPKGKRFGD